MKCIGVALLVALLHGTSAAEYTVRVESGDEPLHNVIVSAAAPDASFPSRGVLRSASGEDVLFERNPFGEVIFVLSHMDRQSVKQFSVVQEWREEDRMRADEQDGRITLTDHGRKVFVYQGAEAPFPRPDIKPIYKRGGFVHPLYTPSGRLLTDSYAANHLHQHGIWWAWTKTEFEGRTPDFWNMGQGKGKVEFVKFGKRWSGGAVHAGFQAEHRFLDLTAPEPKVALEETWTVIAYHVSANHFLFDLISTQRCATASPLKLPKYHYGGLGFRGNWDWNGAKKTEFLTSNGETDRVKGNETRANWCHIGGEVEGQFAGVTIMSHPGNYRAPQPMRLHPTEPFFCFAPSQGGDWEIEPGRPYVSRYRFVVSDGRPDKAAIEEIWNAYARPPKVLIEKH